MSETITAADEAARERTDTARIYDLRGELSGLGEVREVEVHETEAPSLPTRLRVVLDVANVTAQVSDLLAEYHASVVPESIEVAATSGLVFEVRTPERFKNADSMEIRTHGSSIVVTLTREALDLSAFDEGVKVDEQARDGAILLTRHASEE